MKCKKMFQVPVCRQAGSSKPCRSHCVSWTWWNYTLNLVTKPGSFLSIVWSPWSNLNILLDTVSMK
jgi:hypothetical protein